MAAPGSSPRAEKPIVGRDRSSNSAVAGGKKELTNMGILVSTNHRAASPVCVHYRLAYAAKTSEAALAAATAWRRWEGDAAVACYSGITPL